MSDLKVTQMNVHYTVIRENTYDKFKLDHNAIEATKNIYSTKGEGDHQMVQEILFRLQERWQSGKVR